MRKASAAAIWAVALIAGLAMGPVGAQTSKAVRVWGLHLPRESGQTYLADREAKPGAVFLKESNCETPVFTRPGGSLTSLTFGRIPRGQLCEPGAMSLVFCNANRTGIWRVTAPNTEEMVTDTGAFPRTVRFGPPRPGTAEPALYCSYASGAAADGAIIRLKPNGSESYVAIELAKIGGAWGGEFAFDPGGKLYVANGPRGASKVWLYPTDGTAPRVVFRTTGLVSGFCFVDATNFVYTECTNIVLKGRLGGNGPTGLAYESQSRREFCDVVVR